MSGFDDNPFGEVDNPFAVCKIYIFFLIRHTRLYTVMIKQQKKKLK